VAGEADQQVRRPRGGRGMAEEAGHELLQALAGTAGPPRVAVVGLGTSNRAVLRWLLAKGVPVIACDQKSPQALEGYGELTRLPLELWLGPDYLAPEIGRAYV